MNDKYVMSITKDEKQIMVRAALLELIKFEKSAGDGWIPAVNIPGVSNSEDCAAVAEELKNGGYISGWSHAGRDGIQCQCDYNKIKEKLFSHDF